ncbi:MAG: acetyl-CoA carboxylase, carboxyltransferase subunit beta [Methyloligellaceae bacterium]
MNWINNVVRPKIQGMLRKRDMPDNLWVKCPETGQMVFHKDLEANQFVVPGSDYHMRMNAPARLKSLFDDGIYEKMELPKVPHDPLKFRDEKRYQDRLRDARAKTDLEDAVLVGSGRLEGMPVVAAVQDFSFMGGSLGMAAGEAILQGMTMALDQRTPFILFAASGGARMQEGILSLMQMPRTTVAVRRLREAALPYVVVLTDPTTGGVTASYAMLGDLHIAEPGALIGFAGPRVIEQTIREQLPDGFQRAEYLLEHGMVDMVVHRHKMRETLTNVCKLLMHEHVSKRGVRPLIDETPDEGNESDDESVLPVPVAEDKTSEKKQDNVTELSGKKKKKTSKSSKTVKQDNESQPQDIAAE